MGELLSGVPGIRDDGAGFAGGLLGGLAYRGAGPLSAEQCAGIGLDGVRKSELGEVNFFHLLLARGHHRLEGGNARLVDLVGHGDDGGQLGAQRLIGPIDGARDRGGAVGYRELGGDGKDRPVEVGGEGCGHDAHVAIGRGHAGQHQIDIADAAYGGGKHPRGAERIGASELLIADVQAGISAHLQGPAHRVDGILGSHRHGDHFAARLLDERDSGLDGVFVDLVEHIVFAAHEQAIVNSSLRLHVGNVFDKYNYLHAFYCATRAKGRPMSVFKADHSHSPCNGAHGDMSPTEGDNGSVSLPLRASVKRVNQPASDRGRLGVHRVAGGVDVAVYAPRATGIEVCFFRHDGDQEIEEPWLLEGPVHGVWHGHVPGILPGTAYGFRAHGRWDVATAQRFNPDRLLLDPYARAVCGAVTLDDALYDHVRGEDGTPLLPLTPSPKDTIGYARRGVVIDTQFSAAHSRPRVPWRQTVIYEGHVKGLTQLHPDVPEHLRGTYAGLAHPAFIAHLKRLGVTSLELLPIHAMMPEPFLADKGLTNYWGYNTLGFFAPEPSYATEHAQRRGAQAVVEEVTGMVELLHQAGIEVILDVVYNHTCEAGYEGMSLSMRGLDAAGYYLHNPDGTCLDYTGCGNTLDFRRTRVVQLALDSLRYWVQDIGVDGFRFDLAVTLGRHREHFTDHHPFLSALATDPVLRDTKLITEPWDMGPHGWRTGQFPSPLADWNDRYRDTMRTYWLADAARQAHGHAPSALTDFGNRISGSADLFSSGEVPGGRGPLGSINFITAHDGFTMADLVSYNHKHNEANGEDNRDGTNKNLSWNHGMEGFQADDDIAAAIIPARQQSIRNMLGTLVVSAGVPMITAGDEFGRSQQGNNNAYCQDNEISWLNWELADWQDDLAETTAYLLRLRRENPALRPIRFASGRPARGDSVPDLAWFSADATPRQAAQWHDPYNRALQMLRSGKGTGRDALVVFNGSLSDVTVSLAAGRTIENGGGATRVLGWRLKWDSSWSRPTTDEHALYNATDQVSLEPLSMQIYLSERTP